MFPYALSSSLLFFNIFFYFTLAFTANERDTIASGLAYRDLIVNVMSSGCRFFTIRVPRPLGEQQFRSIIHKAQLIPFFSLESYIRSRRMAYRTRRPNVQPEVRLCCPIPSTILLRISLNTERNNTNTINHRMVLIECTR